MKVYQTNQIHNVVLSGNSGSGKTTFAEAMLFEGGVINRRGDVDHKNTASDYYPIEHENGNSVYSSVLHTEYNNKKINILDAPGADDFVGGLVSSLSVADITLMLLNTQNGIEVGTEIHSRYMEKYNVPVILVANQLDHDKTNFDKTIEMAKESFGNNVTIIQYPVNPGPEFDSIIDVITMKMYKFKGDDSKPEIMDIPDNEKDKAEELRNELVEKAAENDESLMEIFFEKETLTEDEMRKGIKEGLVQRGIFPVFCSCAKKNMGISRVMEFITNVAPTPDEMPSEENEEGNKIVLDANGPTSLFVFKSSIESHIGEIVYFKVMSGKVSESMDLVNQNNSTKERISQIFAPAGKNRTKVSEMMAGDIGATVKLKSTKINNTLNVSSEDWKWKPIEFPEPKFGLL